ncbi:Keratin, type I cytoskeletal 18 [Plecturocebus cupreus]
MQSLNDHLASYLDRVRSLETENQKLESKIWEPLEKKGPQIDNACLVADDFKSKYVIELAMCQPVESNIHGLHKVTDDTNLETEIKALKEELLFTKKNHEEEAQYDDLARKKREEVDKYWSQQIEESTTVVTMPPTEVGAAEMMLMELRHTFQSLEIDWTP